MRALFITTQTNDTHNHINAWDSVSPIPAKRIEFNHIGGLGNDKYILDKAHKAGEIDVIFYIGCNRGAGLPSFETFRELRTIAPLINIVSDAADKPWHIVIEAYRREECFDLQVGIDGEPQSPADMNTLTPVDARTFDSIKIDRDIHCGFSGNVAGKRTAILSEVGDRCWIRLRGDDYHNHVKFLKRCRMILNIAFTGSGSRYHIKGRVTETGYAGAALLEPRTSPIIHWFPAHSYLAYGSVDELIETIEVIKDDKIISCAESFSKIVREKYNAGKIYGGMLEKINVVHPF